MGKDANSYWSRVATGLVVIAVGVIFLLRNLGIALPFMQLHNWWALFILLGAVPSLVYAVQRYRSLGRVDYRVWHGLMTSAVVVTVAVIFLMDLPLERWWPLFVIFGGLWVMVKGTRGEQD